MGHPGRPCSSWAWKPRARRSRLDLLRPRQAALRPGRDRPRRSLPRQRRRSRRASSRRPMPARSSARSASRDGLAGTTLVSRIDSAPWMSPRLAWATARCSTIWGSSRLSRRSCSSVVLIGPLVVAEGPADLGSLVDDRLQHRMVEPERVDQEAQLSLRATKLGLVGEVRPTLPEIGDCRPRGSSGRREKDSGPAPAEVL